MPRADSHQNEVWDSLYRAYVGGEEVHYDRRAMETFIGRDPERLIEVLVPYGLLPEHRIALIGSAFGWVGEQFIELGYPLVTCIDTSTWVHDNKAVHAILPIENVDISIPQSRSTLGSFDWAISEDVLPILTDEEAAELSLSMRALAPNVVHWLQALIPGGDQDARLNWKSGEDWKAIVAPDLVVVRNEIARVL